MRSRRRLVTSRLRWVLITLLIPLPLGVSGCGQASGLSGSAKTADSPSVSPSDSPSGPAPSSGSRDDPPLTWKNACVLAPSEVERAMSAFAFASKQPAPGNDDPTSTECNYQDTSTLHSVGINLFEYGTGETYGFLTDTSAPTHTHWTAPDQITAGNNVCAIATGWVYSPTGENGKCLNLAGVTVAIGPDRLNAAVLLPGKYFYVVNIYGITGDENLTEPLQTIAGILATHPPLGQ